MDADMSRLYGFSDRLIEQLHEKNENEDEAGMVVVQRRIRSMLSGLGWRKPNMVQTKGAFRGAHLKTTPCYGQCGKALTPDDIVGIRFFKWNEMPESTVVFRGKSKKSRIFNLFCLCLDCALGDIPPAPRTVGEAVAFQLGQTDEGIQLELSKQMVENDLKARRKALEDLKKQSAGLEKELKDLEQTLMEEDGDLLHQKKKLEEKMLLIRKTKEEMALKGPELEKELQAVRAKYEQMMTEKGKIQVEITKLNEERTKATIDRLTTVGEICQNLKEKHDRQITRLIKSFSSKMEEVEARSLNMIREFQQEMASTLKDGESSMTKSRKIIGRALSDVVDQADEESVKLTGEKMCGVCYNPIFEYVMIEPCGHVYCQSCADKNESCPIDRTRITDRKKLFFPM